MIDEEVPRQWTREAFRNHEIYGLKVGDNHCGFVTVDFKERTFRMGHMNTAGPKFNDRAYLGRDWRLRLINAARAALAGAVGQNLLNQNEE